MHSNHKNSRRNFLSTLAAGSAALTISQPSFAEARGKKQKEPVSFHVFSKHLQFLDYDHMAEAAAEIGFDGVDLTVRPGGHVLPENVARDLPKAVEAVKKQGLQAKMMTTALLDPDNATNQTLLNTASEQGIQYYRTNWLKYPEKISIPEYMKECRKKLTKLAKYNQKLDIYGSYQNHSGRQYVGAPVWDIALILSEINSPHLGNQYDIRHATVEGGEAWPLGLQYIHPHINTIVMKDFRWEEKDGKWQVFNTPIGEGMVDFASYFNMLKELNLSAPVSFHYEYEMPEHDDSLSEQQKLARTKEVMKKDLTAVKEMMKDAGLI
ncbi:L-ribulose-5-phosphate 3-epimerase [Catalinimonas alkaloidigena]|uniref:sugar phosphate isomerase/epimerase family protein n=1 Tax=Catalinimonas alkaloidigena TaxID=1075417 RepID=UPI00240755CE|nr:sugar phosphate isomerase/epimerase [Catalinimonas alkaloidigena]MDF9795695.1 L-ribulose-5-phosphate 3-epimerase [Catalinimonas alkaloidigena]